MHRFWLRWLWRVVAATLIILAVLVSLGRMLVPELGNYRHSFEQAASDRLGLPVRVGRLSGQWRLAGPVITLHDVHIGPNGAAAPLRLRSVELALDIWRSALAAEPVAKRLAVEGLAVQLAQQTDGRWRIREFPTSRGETPLASVAEFLLLQRAISLNNSELTFLPVGKTALQVRLPELALYSAGDKHQLVGRGYLHGAHAGALQIVWEAEGDPREASTPSRLYIKAEQLPLTTLAERFGYGAQGITGTLAGELWAQAMGQRLQRAQLKFHGQDLSFAADKALTAGAEASWPHLQQAAGQLLWQRQGQGWRLTARDVALRQGGQDWLPLTGQLSRRGEQGWALGFERVELASLTRLAAALPALDREVGAMLKMLNPNGELHQLQSIWDGEGKRWAVSAELKQVSWQPYRTVPGVTALDARIYADEQGGDARVSGARGAALPALFREPFTLQRLKAGVNWRTGENGWRLAVLGGEVVTPGAAAKTRLVLDSPRDAPAELSLYAELRDGDSGAAGQFYPSAIMAPSLVAYLDRSVQAGGRLPSARAVVRGPLPSFPFENAEGIFAIAARAEDLPFQFQPDWPRIDALDADLFFEGNGMRILADSGDVLGLKLKHAEARIADFAAAELTVKAQASGQGDAITALLRSSPLPTLVGAELGRLTLQGQTETALTLTIPLEHAADTRLQGELTLQQATLGRERLGPILTEASGVLAFSEQGASTRALRGRLLGEPVSVDLGPRAEGGMLLTARGTLSAAALAQAGLPHAERLAGEARYTAALTIAPKDDEVRLSLTSDLRGMGIELPAPMGLTGEGSLLTVEADLLASTLSGRLGEDLSVALAWQDDGQRSQVDSIAVGLGAVRVAMPTEPGLHFSGHLPAVAAEPWVRTVLALLPDAPAESGEGFFKGLSVKVDALDLYGFPLNNGVLQIKPSPEGLMVGLNSDELTGTLLVPEDRERQALVIDLDRAHLPALPESHAPGDIGLLPGELPRLLVNCGDCAYGARQFGMLRLVTAPDGEALTIRELTLRSRSGGRLALTGRWQGGKEESVSLRGRIDAPDAALLGRDLGLGSSAQDSTLTGQFELAWPGDPAQFAWANAQGSAQLKLGPGHLEEVSDQGGRVFSLFSLQSMRRRLTLDFSDVFQKGFVYDGIDIALTVKDGFASADKAVIDGLAARVEISGRTDLVNKRFEQTMRVSPKLSSSLPLLAGWAVDPTTALVVILVNTVLSPALEVITRIDYRITGPWEQPEIVEIGKTQGKVPIDPATIPKPPAPTPAPLESPLP